VVKNTSLFSQLLRLVPSDVFAGIVKRHNGERHARGFSCRQQFVAMLFCVMGKAQSLREITGGLATCEGKLRHLGITAPKKSSLAYANEHRPWQIYQEAFFHLLSHCKAEAKGHRRTFRLKKKMYSIDSTTIDLCLSMFDWAHFRRRKGGIKIHLRLDHDGYLPDYAVITEAKVHDSQVLKDFQFDPDSISILDRAYNDYVFFGSMCAKDAHFVTRLKSNAKYEVVEELELKGKNILRDEVIRFTGPVTKKKCPYPLRIVEYYDEDKQRSFIYLTNNLKLAASTIARTYKERWQIESFFKSLKQHIKIKTFVGTSPNAVKIQVWTALIGILLLKYLKLKSTFGWSLSNLAALLRMNLFTYRDLWEWINKPFETLPVQVEPMQMELKLE
jgi:hypothetical protein